MAELNFGLLTPPGSQSIGNAFVQGMDQAAAARAQENQNALAQYTLGKAKREDELTNKMLAGMQSATTLEQQAAVLRSVGRYKDASDLMNSDLERRYRLGQIEAQPGAQAKTKADTAILHGNIMEREATAVVANPTSARAMQAVVNFGRATGQDVTQELKTLTELGDDPNKIAAWARGHALKGKDLAAFSTPKPTPTNVGNRIVFLDLNPNSPTFKSEVMPSQNIGVSPNTQSTLAQAQQHYDGLSAYQKEQLRVQGKQFDSDRGVIVDVKNGTFEPVYSYPSSTPSAPAAPAAISTAPIATPAGTSITQPRAATPGTFPRVNTVQQTNNMEGATAIRRQELANEQSALENARQKLASSAAATDPDIRRFYEERFKEATSNIDALNKELGNQPAQPSATQPAQRTVLGPKPEKATESYFKELKGVINTNDAINNLKQMVSTFTPADMLNPARRAEIDTAHKTAVLLAKEMFNLGVLNGGDQKILEQVIPDPISFSKGLVPIETIRKNLDAASSVASRMNATLSKVHKQPLVQLDTIKPNEPNTPPPPIQSFRRP